MLTASQDIDHFIERERSRINKQGYHVHGSPPQQGPPPPPPPPPPEQLTHRTVHFSEEHSNHHYQPSGPFAGHAVMNQEFAHDDPRNSYLGFSGSFGTHEHLRARLNRDLKREYNDYLQSLQNMARSRAAQMNTPRGGGVTRQSYFQQYQSGGGGGGGGSSQDSRAIHNTHSMNDMSSSSRTIRHSQSMNEGSSGRAMHNVHSMNDLSSTVTSELANNRARARLIQQHSEQYIRDREEYILELYEQIYELEARIRQLEGGTFRQSLN